ncbi:MAG TPA: patatin-like phospholipase family protein [Solirubrobacterales bacterium]|nr:patatin-like phospholipase family protein [Solirubrobacterales bacterium]
MNPEAAPDRAGIALCLSGGGYRAMLFHLGSLWRLNEMSYLPKLDQVSSVSGGSITAGTLALAWKDLAFDDSGKATAFTEAVAAPLHALAERTIDVAAVARGLFWFGSIGNRVAGSYRKHLYGEKTLQDLPDHPNFVFDATNLQSGKLWRFSKPYMADYKVGYVPDPRVELAEAVAASSAFPPVLSPFKLKLAAGAVGVFPGDKPELHHEPYTREVVLSDGGVYDNLGLEGVAGKSNLLLVSDGGGRLEPTERPRRDWPLQMLRVLHVIDSQVRALRASELIEEFQRRKAAGERGGTLWTIRTPIEKYSAPAPLPVSERETKDLAKIKTRLAKLSRRDQERLVNWGYAACDAAMSSYVEEGAPAVPAAFPYPAATAS